MTPQLACTNLNADMWMPAYSEQAADSMPVNWLLLAPGSQLIRLQAAIVRQYTYPPSSVIHLHAAVLARFFHRESRVWKAISGAFYLPWGTPHLRKGPATIQLVAKSADLHDLSTHHSVPSIAQVTTLGSSSARGICSPLYVQQLFSLRMTKILSLHQHCVVNLGNVAYYLRNRVEV